MGRSDKDGNNNKGTTGKDNTGEGRSGNFAKERTAASTEERQPLTNDKEVKEMTDEFQSDASVDPLLPGQPGTNGANDRGSKSETIGQGQESSRPRNKRRSRRNKEEQEEKEQEQESQLPRQRGVDGLQAKEEAKKEATKEVLAEPTCPICGNKVGLSDKRGKETRCLNCSQLVTPV